MQVISGKYRKRKLNTLEGRNTRPTSSRVKEDMFNILSNYFIYDNKVVIDLFSGSAALGIEALSRGAKFCYFNDHNASAINVIKNNLSNLQIKDYYLTNFSLIILKYKQYRNKHLYVLKKEDE